METQSKYATAKKREESPKQKIEYDPSSDFKKDKKLFDQIKTDIKEIAHKPTLTECYELLKKARIREKAAEE